MIENHTYTQTERQGFLLAPPPLKARTRKLPEDCFLSFIDQGPDGYGSAKLVRNEPRTNKDTYFIIKTRATSVRSYRRNKTHISVALFRNKKDGAKRSNIAYLTCSFLELDGSTDGTIKTKTDVLTLARKNNLLEGLQTSQTSPGRFHLKWDYNDPLPWTTKNESYWISQQKRKIELFSRDGFLVDKGASMNPCQFLRNPSQLNPYNYKRRCKVEIHKSYSKTSLRAIYKALNGTNIANPKRVQASVRLRRYLRANKTFTLTLSQLAENLGTALRTVQTQVSRAVQNGDIQITARLGNNSEKTRTTQYKSLIFIEQFPEVQLSSIKNNSLPVEGLLRDFKQKGTSVGRRQKTIFALGLYLKSQLGKRACVEAIRDALKGGAMRCHFPEKEFERTLKNVMKNSYTNPFSLSKLREWGLLEETKNYH